MSFQISPNPFNNQFSINFTLKNNTALLEIHNVIGKKIKNKNH